MRVLVAPCKEYHNPSLVVESVSCRNLPELKWVPINLPCAASNTPTDHVVSASSVAMQTASSASSVTEACLSEAGPPFNRSRVSATARAAAREKVDRRRHPPDPSPAHFWCTGTSVRAQAGTNWLEKPPVSADHGVPHVHLPPRHTTSTASRHECPSVLVCCSYSSSPISMESSDQRMAS